MKTTEFFMWMGPFKIPMIIIALIIILLITKKAIDIFFRYKNSGIDVKNHLDSILFWGRLGLIVGILAQITGIYSALTEIMHASEISPQVVMIGFRGSFTSTIFGLFLLIIAYLSWYFLKLRTDKIS